MSYQFTFADSEFSSKRRQTRREIFLSRMNNLLPWSQLLEVIEPFYLKAANEHDLSQLKNLLHGEEEFISGDAGCQGAEKPEELKNADVEWLIAERPGKVRALKKHPRKNKTAINIEYLKASIRARWNARVASSNASSASHMSITFSDVSSRYAFSSHRRNR